MNFENGESNPNESQDNKKVKEIWDGVLELIDKVEDEDVEKMKKRLADVNLDPKDYDDDYILTMVALESLDQDGLNNLINDLHDLPDSQKHLPGIHSLPSKITVLNILKSLEQKKKPA